MQYINFEEYGLFTYSVLIFSAIVGYFFASDIYKKYFDKYK